MLQLQRPRLQFEPPCACPVHDTFGTSVITPVPLLTTHFLRYSFVLKIMSSPLQSPHVCIDFLLMNSTTVLANSSTPAAPPASTSAIRVVQRHSARQLPFHVSMGDHFVVIMHMHIHYSLPPYFSPASLAFPLSRRARLRVHLILHTIWQAFPSVLPDTLASPFPTPSLLPSVPNALALTCKISCFPHFFSPPPLTFPCPSLL